LRVGKVLENKQGDQEHQGDHLPELTPLKR